MLLERFRQLVELEEGSRAAPPRYEPAAGALLEAYRAAGLRPRYLTFRSQKHEARVSFAVTAFAVAVMALFDGLAGSGGRSGLGPDQ